MKKAWKILAATVLLGVMNVGLVGCGGGNNSSEQSSAKKQEANVNNVAITATDVAASNIFGIGGTIQLQATTAPVNDGENVYWSSSDPKVATVDDKGLVTGVALGYAKIIASYKEYQGTYMVFVSANADESCTIRYKVDETERTRKMIKVGDKFSVEDLVTVLTEDGDETKDYVAAYVGETLESEGHVFTAKQPGAFPITIVAGKTRRAITGKVMSEKLDAFRTMVKAMDEDSWNYMAMSDLNGFAISNKNSLWESVSDGILDGVMYNDEKTVPASLKYSGHDIAHLNINRTAIIGNGYGFTRQDSGMMGWDLSSTWGDMYAWEERTFELDSVDGAQTTIGWGLLNDGEDVPNVELLLTSVLGSNASVWWVYEYYLSEAYHNTPVGGLAVVPTGEDSFSIYPMTEDYQLIPTLDNIPLTDGSTGSFDASIGLFNIGKVNLPAVDAWLASPVDANKVDVSPIKTFFAGAMNAKNYTQHVVAEWLGEGECPEGWKFDGAPVLYEYDVTTMVSENKSYQIINNIEENAYLLGLEDPSPAANGIVDGLSTLRFLKNSQKYTASGLKDLEGVTTWEPAQAAAQSYWTSPWFSSHNTALYFDYASLLNAVNTGKEPGILDLKDGQEVPDLIDLASWSNKTGNEVSNYTYNFNGPDTKYTDTQDTAGSILYFAFAGNLLSTLTTWTYAIAGASGSWLAYGSPLDVTLQVADGAVTLKAQIAMSSDNIYELRSEWKDVGTTAFPSHIDDVINDAE